MKILILSDRNYPYFKGGAEKKSWDISRGLIKKGHNVTYISGKWPEMKDKEEKIEGITIKGIYNVKEFYKNGKKSIFESIKYSLNLLPLVLKEDFDIMDADEFPVMHIIPAKIASILKNKPLVVTWHEAWGKEYWQSYIGKYKGYIGYLIEKLATKLPDKILAISEHTKRELIKRLNVNPKNIQIIPCAIDLNKINKIKPSKEKSDIIFIGRLISHKNVDLLIESISIIKQTNKNIKCIIVGDGPERKNLENLSNSKGLSKNIIFKGFLKEENDIYALMKSSKVLALPSEREGFGIVVIEAFASGIPVVTIDNKDNASKFLISQNKTGYISKKDKTAYSISLKRALASNISMTKACKEEAKKFDLKETIKQVELIYKNEIKK